MSFSITPPRDSPDSQARQNYFKGNFQRQRDGSSGSSPGKRLSRFEENLDPGLGIWMSPVASPKSPGNIYRSSQQIPAQEGSYSPLPTYSRRRTYTRTPDSVGSFNSAFSRARTDPTTERLIQHRATQAAQWTVHWRTPTMVVVSFLTGILLALGQHLLYNSLHRKAEPDEGMRIRVVLYGRALAYLSKVAFGGCCILCYRQRIWRTFRGRALSVWSIDQIFLATEDPSLFLNWETVSRATLLVLMAMVIWLIPVATIVFSPAALTFGDTLEAGNLNLSVPTLNFSAESFKDWRVPVTMPDGTSRRSLCYYNTTDREAKMPNWFDYYDQPSADLKRITVMAAYNLREQSLNREDARRESCGGDFNCTYSISFTGPGYNCQVLDDEKLADAGAPFNSSIIVPNGPYVYYSDVDSGEYVRPQPAVGGLSNRGGVPLGEIEDDFGFFKSEPVLWVGYAINSTEPLPSDSPFTRDWTHRFDQYIFACTHYETKYTVGFNYSGPFFTTDIDYEFIKPIVDTHLSRFENGTDAPYPPSNFISPRVDPPQYKLTAAYHAVGERLRSYLRGNLQLEAPRPGPSYTKVYSEITSTRLVTTSSTPRENLHGLLQSFYADMVLSILSNPQMLIISTERVPVSRSRFQSTFIYNSRKLWACYAPVIFFTLILLLVGVWTIYEDGTTFSVGFSRIMVTTRNTTLDEISRGACLGNDPFPMELMHTRLKFGVLNEGGHEHEYMGLEELQGAGHCAFGVPSEMTPIQRGVAYAGLQRRRYSGILEEDAVRQKKEKAD